MGNTTNEMSSPPRQRRRIEQPAAPSRVRTPREMYPLPPEPTPTLTEIRYRELHGKYPPSYMRKHDAYIAEVSRIENEKSDARKRIYMVHPSIDENTGSGNTCVGALCDGLPKLNPETGMPVYTPKPRNMSAAEMRQVIATRNPIAPKPPKYRPQEKSTWKSRSRGYHSEYRGGSCCPICGEHVY